MAEVASWEERFRELHEGGASLNEIADDPVLRSTLCEGLQEHHPRYLKVWRAEQRMIKDGTLTARRVKIDRAAKNDRPDRVPVSVRAEVRVDHISEPEVMQELFGLPAGKSQAEKLIEEFEKQIGHYKRYALKPQGDLRGRREYVIASDFHMGDERQDLLARLCSMHAGEHLIIGGDFWDFSSLSRFPANGWNDPGLYDCLSRGAAALDILKRNFASVTLVIGNHDHRAWRKGIHNISTEYGKFTHEMFLYMLEHKFGVRVVDHVVEHQDGRRVEGLHYWHQVGDCIVSHTEHCGKQAGKGADGSYEFFRDWQDILGLDPFRVILHAHTHKQSYHRSRNGKVHLFELGCMCDWQAYSLQGKQVYGPPQHGYYRLVQNDGVTDINESRLVCLDS